MTHASAVDRALRLAPGRPLPTIAGARSEWVPRLTAGRPAQGLPALLGALFTLCASAHRLASRLALAAAQGQDGVATPDDRRALRLSQLREQLLRITLDWPSDWPFEWPRDRPGAAPSGDGALLLRGCPLWRHELDADAQLAALPGWLAQAWLGQPPAAWLAAHEADPRGWAARWCEDAPGPVATLLRCQRDAAQRLATATDPLPLLHDPAATLPRLAAAMVDEPGFCQAPLWDGRPRESGPWTRMHDPVPLVADSAWPRLVARVVDVLRLAAPAGEGWLAHGALVLGPAEGVAWVEMARGLLVHRVRLDGRGAAARVADCRVLAPTEWNFHPRGVLAQALAGLSGPGAADDARRLALAFDPCVAFEVDAPPVGEVAAHA